MNTERLFTIILMDFSLEKLKIEEELQNVINSDTPVDEKVRIIKGLVSKLTSIDADMVKFTQLTNTNKND
jgi:hypothetical protein